MGLWNPAGKKIDEAAIKAAKGGYANDNQVNRVNQLRREQTPMGERARKATRLPRER